MYLRPVHSTFHLPILYRFVQKNPLGLLTTYIPVKDQAPLQSSHIPWVLDLPAGFTADDLSNKDLSASDANLSAVARLDAGKPLGVLRAHLSRANPQAKGLVAAAKATAAEISTSSLTDATPMPDGGVTLPEEVLLTFTGPVQSYITPKFYTTTKPSTGKVVPTWNYEAVEVYGRITVYPSTTSDQADEFLSKAIDDLSHWAEFGVMGFDGEHGRQKEWEVKDAPERYIGLLKKAIVGVEVEVIRIGGKWKMSQEMGPGDREGVVEGLKANGKSEVAELVESLGTK